MNNKFTARIKAWLPVFALMCFFALTFGQARAATTTFTTDTTWRVTSNFFAGWNNNPFTLTPPWVVPGGGNTNCGIAQPGVVGVAKIWFPATNAFRNCYFRKKFSISQLCEVKTATVEIAAADNYLFFINGVALGSGNATAKTFNIPVQLLQCENVIAVQARDIDAKCWWMSAKITINSTPYTFTAGSNTSSSNPLCAGQTLNLTSTGLAGATYSWTGPNGFTSNLQNPLRPTVSVADTGTYTVIVSVGKCCRYIATTNVFIKKCKDCLDFSLKEIVCKNGVYYLSMCVKNTSSHVANSINLISTTPGVTYTPNILYPPGGLLPGSTYCTTVVVGGSGAVSGAKVCLKGMLVEIKDCKQSWFCTTDDDFCITLPDCVKPCTWSAMVKDSLITICKGASTTLSAYTSPAVAGVTYNWTSAPASVIVGGTTANPMVTPLANPTVYTVTITDNSTTGTLCVKTAKVIVYLKDCPPPIPCDSVTVNFSPSTVTICLGDSIMLNPITNPATGLTYLWLPSTGLSNATIKNPWAKPLVTTTYNLIVSYGPNCKKDRSMTVVVKPCNTQPCQWQAMVKDTSVTICKGLSTTLGAYTSPVVVGAMYNWTSSPASLIVNGTTATPTVTPTANPTIYTVTITVPSTNPTIPPCVKTAIVKVYQKDCPPVLPCDSVKLGFAPNTVTICLGDSVMLNPITNPVTGLTYLWIPATGLSSATIKNPWAKPLVTTTYNLIVSYGPNCKKDASMTVVVKPCNTPLPCQWKAMVKDSAITICRGTSAILGAYTTPAVVGAMYNWTSTPASTIVNGNTASPTVTPLMSPTVYTVTISVPNTDGTICTKTAKVTVYWKDCPNPVGTRVAADENSLEEITVAPNPTQSVISVQIPDSFNWKSATLINQQGIILNEQDRTDDAKSVKFDVQKQPSGMYIIRVKTDKGFVNKKVMKE